MKVTDEGTDSLFQQYPIKGIQEIERKLRNDIEKKKEDLRQMVGERYQDLMNAADTITDMKTSAESVTLHIKAMEERCFNIYSQASPSGLMHKSSSKTQKIPKPDVSKFSFSVLLKIMMDMPTLLWSAVDNHNFTEAAEIYLISQYVVTSLSYNPSQIEGGIEKTLPIVASQIVQIGKYRYTVLQSCREVLKKEDLTDVELTDILCTLLLLDDVNLLDILQEFFDMRMAALDHILKLDKDDSTISSQVCEVVTLICNTIQLVKKVFHSTGPENSLLVETYYNFASENKPGPICHFNLEFCPAFQYIPDNVKCFRCTLNSKLKPVSSENLQTSCKNWLMNVTALVQLKLKNLLHYVASIKGIAAICQCIDESFESLPADEWGSTCNAVLGQSFSPYSDLLKPVIIERVKVLLSDGLQLSFTDCSKKLFDLLQNLLLNNRLNDNEKDLTRYIWSESTNDLLVQPGWLTQNESSVKLGTLAMKASGYTPNIQTLCNSLDESIEFLLKDLNSFDEVRQKCSESIAEMNELRLYSRDKADVEIKKLLDFISQMLTECANEDAILLWNPFIGRFCHAVCVLCPNLKLCFTYNIAHKETDGDWPKIRNEIFKISQSTLKEWVLTVVRKEIVVIELSLQNCDPACMLQSVLAWDETEISEETEDGATVKSRICVPLQPSGFLQSALMNFCCKINKTVGHSLPKDIIRLAGHEILRLSLTYYASAAEKLKIHDNSRFVQNFALQLLFDLQFLSTFFPAKLVPELVSKCDSVVTSLESLIDPFDLDVFNPALHKNLNVALHKSSLLLGMLLYERLSTVPPQSNQSQPSNLLLSSGGVTRFQLLPITNKMEKQQTIDNLSAALNSPPKMSRGYGSSPSLSSVGDPNNVSKSSSFYDRFSAMGASWFGSTQ